MTETMLAKMARAMYDYDASDFGGAFAPWETCKEGYVSQARAALEAIREPDNETAWALATASGTQNKNRAAQDFTAMIDAILSQSQEGGSK